MAGKRAVSAALAIFSRVFAGVVDDQMTRLYHAALEEVSDEELACATAELVKTHRGDWIPKPAVIRDVVRSNLLQVVDADATLRRIEKLGSYNANSGWIYPTVGVVEAALGTAAGRAYAAAGGPRLFSENDVSRDIARREFQKVLTEAFWLPGSRLPVIGPTPTDRTLPPSTEHDG